MCVRIHKELLIGVPEAYLRRYQTSLEFFRKRMNGFYQLTILVKSSIAPLYASTFHTKIVLKMLGNCQENKSIIFEALNRLLHDRIPLKFSKQLFFNPVSANPTKWSNTLKQLKNNWAVSLWHLTGFSVSSCNHLQVFSKEVILKNFAIFPLKHLWRNQFSSKDAIYKIRIFFLIFWKAEVCTYKSKTFQVNARGLFRTLSNSKDGEFCKHR